MLSLSLSGLILWPCLVCAIITIQEPKLGAFFAKFSRSVKITVAGLLLLNSFVGQPLAFKHAYVDRLLKNNHDASISERFSKRIPHPNAVPNKNEPNRQGAQSLREEKDFGVAKTFLVLVFRLLCLLKDIQ